MLVTGASAALDDTRREATHLAGVLCVDIHSFATQTSVEQARSRSVLIEALREALAEMAPASWWQIDVQHGILIVCPISPDDVMYLAQCLLQHHELNRWRVGLHVGLLHSAPDLEGRTQTVGDGVARARTMATHAAPAQALATRAYVDAVRDSRPGYSALFVPAVPTDTTSQLPQAADGRAPERWAVVPSADWLITLRDEVVRRSMSSQSRRLAAAQTAALGGDVPGAASAHTPNPSAEPRRASASLAETEADAPPLTQARDLIARWFVPVNALLVSIGLLLSQGYRVGLTEQRLLWLGLTLVVLAFVWLLVTRRTRVPAIKGSSAGAWVGLSYGALLSLSATAALVFSLPQPAGSGIDTQVAPLTPAQLTPPSAELPSTQPLAAPPLAATLPAAAAAAQATVASKPPAPLAASPAMTPATTPPTTPATEAQARPPAARAAAVAPNAKPASTQTSASATARPSANAGADPVIARGAAQTGPQTGSQTALPNTSPANAGRCNAIVARSALGEPLSPEDRQELLTSCR